MTRGDIIRKAQAEVIMKGQAEDYPLEDHLRDMDLLADLSILHKKYRDDKELT